MAKVYKILSQPRDLVKQQEKQKQQQQIEIEKQENQKEQRQQYVHTIRQHQQQQHQFQYNKNCNNYETQYQCVATMAQQQNEQACIHRPQKLTTTTTTAAAATTPKPTPTPTPPPPPTTTTSIPNIFSIRLPSYCCINSYSVFTTIAPITSHAANFELKRKFQLNQLLQIGSNFDTRGFLYMTLIILIYCCILLRVSASATAYATATANANANTNATTTSLQQQQHERNNNAIIVIVVAASADNDDDDDANNNDSDENINLNLQLNNSQKEANYSNAIVVVVANNATAAVTTAALAVTEPKPISTTTAAHNNTTKVVANTGNDIQVGLAHKIKVETKVGIGIGFGVDDNADADADTASHIDSHVNAIDGNYPQQQNVSLLYKRLYKRDAANVPDDDDDSSYHDDEFDEYDALIKNKSAKGKYIGAPCNDMKCEPTLLHVSCDKDTQTCGCERNYPVQLGLTKGCAKPKKLGEQCFYDETCMYNDENSLCMQVRHNAMCQCATGFHSVSYTKPTRRVFCTQDLSELNSDLPTLLGVTTGIAVLAGLICMVLHLFSKTKYPRHRNFGDANLPPPIMYSSETGNVANATTTITLK